MKKRLLAFTLCALLGLSGCSTMLERSYVSSAAHVDYSVTEDASILRAESYQGLVNSILYFISEHDARGTIRLYNYTGDVEADLASACDEVLQEDPLGAYAVRTLNYQNTRILTYYEVEVSITYARSAEAVAAVRSVNGLSGLRQELGRMATSYQSEAALRVSYFTGDARLVSDLFWLAFYSNPSAALSKPELTVTFYPEEGSQRIAVIRANWPDSTEELSEYSRALSDAAVALMEARSPPVGERYTVEALAELLHSTVTYDPSGSQDPLAALRGEPTNDLGLLLAMELLCQQAGLEVTVVADEAGAQLWLIVSTPSGYRHLLPRDLRPGPNQGGMWTLPLYTDEQLTELGFTWPGDLHPVCVDYSGSALK